MNLGFYYHIPVIPTLSGIKIPAYLGVFLNSLAEEVTTLTLFMHESRNNEDVTTNYLLSKDNIKFVSLGQKTPAWHRFIRPGKILDPVRSEIEKCDVILVRAPSPLAPIFYFKFHNLVKISYLVVGDYIDDSKHINQPFVRKLAIRFLSIRNDRQLSKALKKCITMVNSGKLYEKYSHSVANLHLIRTTTISKKDFYSRDDTCQESQIRILYAGSFSYSKGLLDLIHGFSVLYSSRTDISLHFVGWEPTPGGPFEAIMKREVDELGISDMVFFHGFKNAGPDLNEMYRMADVYIIPSYQEGFPRTIWEAMANCLPVIATKVGSIPNFLEDRKNALLIEPGNPAQIAATLKLILHDKTLRRAIIRNAYELVKDNTLEIQTKKLISIVQSSA